MAAHDSRDERRSAAAEMRAYAEAMLMVAASTVLGLAIAPRWGSAAVDLLYLPAVLAAAVLGGLRPALLAALASALAYNFFFTAPRHTFRVHSPADVVTIVILFLVAVVTSQLASSIRRQARIAAAHAARNATIAGLARRLLSCGGEREIATVAVEELAGLLGCNAVLVGGGPEPTPIASAPAPVRLTPGDVAAAALVLETGEPAGRGVTRVDPIEWQFHPVLAESAVLAAIGLARDDGAPPVAPEQLALLRNLLDQIALALERSRLENEAREVAGLRERDRLRSALLSSVGHDLRTPLTAIIAAAAELRYRRSGDEVLVSTLESEASKLERYISNLLDMARIETGSVRVRTEPVDLVDAVSAALRDVQHSLSGHDIEVDLPPDLPLVRTDPQLLHHCLINLLDNAGRHSGPASFVRIGAGMVEEGGLLLSVEDNGVGLVQPGGLETFATISGSDRSGGSGLGLAIVKAFAEAMGVGVDMSGRKDRKGAAFTLIFPVSATLAAAEQADAC